MIRFTTRNCDKISTARLYEIAQHDILAHMSSDSVSKHMPLLTFQFNQDRLIQFIANKEKYWSRDGLGHWAFLCNGIYIGWGGFQKEADEWDFGLVLRPEYYGLGIAITKAAIEYAQRSERIPFITFLLPYSRRNIKAIERLGARYVGDTTHAGIQFKKFYLDTK